MDTPGYKELNVIIKKAMSLCEGKLNEYQKYFDLAIDCYQDLRLHYVEEGRKIAKLDVDSTLKTIEFPDDMLRYISLGIIINGELVKLTRRDSINPTTTESGGSEGYDSDIGEGEDVVDLFWDGFATRGGLNADGYYYVDRPNSRFMFRNITVTKIWLHYISSGVHLDSTTFVPVEYEQAFIAYMVWQVSRYKKSIPRSEREYNKNEYEEEIIKLHNNQIGTLDEIIDTIDNTIYLGVKR